jgi:Methane oxygenase PmoA
MSKKFIASCGLICLVVSVVNFETKAISSPSYVTVVGGSFDRKDSVVSFAMPKGLNSQSYVLRGDAGDFLPLQLEPDGTATFVLPELKAGATKRYQLVGQNTNTGATAQGVQSVSDHGRLTISASGRNVLTYQAEPGELPRPDIKPIFRRGGYIHPVFAPSGRVVTDDFPPDHFHHHGIWFAWTKTEFEGRHPDFWNVGDGTGTVEFVALDEKWSGPVHGGFKSRNRYVDVSAPKPTTVLNEHWLVKVYNAGRGAKPYTMFDLVSTQDLASSSPLFLPEYRYGGIGFRGHRQWLAKDNCDFLTSEGKDRNNGHGTRARWCHIGGRIDGQLAGIAILDHPSNFRAPQAMRINPDQPFFCYSPSLIGDWKIEPGKPYVSRYRFIVYDGAPDRAELDRLWNDYANPVQVSISQ